MSRNSGEQPPEKAKSDNSVPTMMDRSTVVTIDEASDVDEPFVSDLRKHAAQNPENDDNEGDANDIDPVFLAEVQRYAAQPPRINADRNDKTLEEIDKRVRPLFHEHKSITKPVVAQQFAGQSPLGQHKIHKPESSAEAVVTSIEQPVGRTVEEVDEPVERMALEASANSTNAKVPRGTHKSPVEIVPRAHSWDPSQSSDYVYSDEEVAEVMAKTNNAIANGSPADDNDQVIIAQEDEHGSNDLVEDERSIRYVQNETIDGPAKLVKTHEDSSSGSENDEGVQHVVDLSSPTRSNASFPDRDQSTSSKPDEAPTHLKRKRFGLFASNTNPDNESESEVSEDARPQRLQDLVRKRRRERKEREKREEREVARKKARYNLRPRRQPSSRSALSNDEMDLVTKDEGQRPRRITRSMTAAFETDNEVERPRRITRSMRTTEPTRKSVPRWKAARKTAPSMRITSKDDYHQQTVQVVIPAIDKSNWNFTPSSASLLEPEEKSLAADRHYVTQAALAGKGMKRVAPDSEEEPQSGKQILDAVLID